MVYKYPTGPMISTRPLKYPYQPGTYLIIGSANAALLFAFGSVLCCVVQLDSSGIELAFNQQCPYCLHPSRQYVAGSVAALVTPFPGGHFLLAISGSWSTVIGSTIDLMTGARPPEDDQPLGEVPSHRVF